MQKRMPILAIVLLIAAAVPATASIKGERQFISHCYAEGLSAASCADVRAAALKAFVAKGKESMSRMVDLCNTVCIIGQEDRKSGANRLPEILKIHTESTKAASKKKK